MVSQERKTSARLVRSPLLILEYLSGREDFPIDTPKQRAARPEEGDYISRMHRRVKAKFREVAPDYQWVRAHSFKSLVLMLERLGLVERTGVTDCPPWEAGSISSGRRKPDAGRTGASP